VTGTGVRPDEGTDEGTDGEPAAIAAGSQAAAVTSPAPRRRRGDTRVALVFLLPALVFLGALVLYPIVATVARSLFDRSGDDFVGLANYSEALTSRRTLHALRNNAIWVVLAPTVSTALGLVFAVLSERVRWSTAFKLVVFMPMAISMLAAGVIFRLVYEESPERGVGNAVVTSVAGVFRGDGEYAGVRARPEAALRPEDDGDGFTAAADSAPGEVALLPLVGIPPDQLPDSARPAAAPERAADGVTGVVWLDFAAGGGGVTGELDRSERGMPGVVVEARRDGRVVATATTAEDGSFVFEGVEGPVRLSLGGDPFREPFRGVEWLGPTLVTPSIIAAYVWIWAGFAMVVIGAGLAAIPRETLEAARVDGATEWQVFRRVTAPLLAPVLVVVFVTLAINVLKVFDLVLVIPPGSVQDDANVLALEMWRVSFGGARNQGLGSALAVLLFLLVVPAMLFNIRRFRREDS
jgi:alpha-glucoside transport system permease protein